MTPHVDHQLFDFLEGRLPVARHAEIETHLAECGECRETFRTARLLREDVLDHGARHVQPDRLVGVADGSGPGLEAAEAAHLDRCARCREELRWLEDLPDPVVEGFLSRLRAWWRDRFGGVRGQRLGLWATAGALAAIAALLLLVPDRNEPLAHLASIEPIEIPRPRGEGPAADDAFGAGLAAYLRRDWVEAQARFAESVADSPAGAEVLLLLGSTEMLLERPRAAADALERAADQTDDVEILSEILWQRANVSLLLSRREEAMQFLDRLLSLNARHRLDAERLLADLRDGD